jgi:hypothetical protein
MDGELLAQIRPVGTTAVTLLTVPTGGRGVRYAISRIQVANTSAGAATWRLFHDDDGTTYDETTALFWDSSVSVGQVASNQAVSPFSAIFMKPGATLGFRSSVGNALTVSVYGTVIGGR